MNRADAEARDLKDGETVTAGNDQGAVRFTLKISGRVPAGTVVTEGVWWREFIPGDRGVNALTSQRLTDGGRGSTLYDVTVEVRGEAIYKGDSADVFHPQHHCNCLINPPHGIIVKAQ